MGGPHPSCISAEKENAGFPCRAPGIYPKEGYPYLILGFASSRSDWSFDEGSLNLARKIMAAMMYGLKDASL